MAIKRFLVDTNILLDAFDVEREEHDEAICLFSTCEKSTDFEGIASISSFKDMYFILNRLYKSEQLAREAVECLMGRAIMPVDLCASYGTFALESEEPDFEDALIRITAEQEKVDVIVSRDKSAFAGSSIPRMSAGEVLNLLN